MLPVALCPRSVWVEAVKVAIWTHLVFGSHAVAAPRHALAVAFNGPHYMGQSGQFCEVFLRHLLGLVLLFRLFDFSLGRTLLWGRIFALLALSFHVD